MAEGMQSKAENTRAQRLRRWADIPLPGDGRSWQTPQVLAYYGWSKSTLYRRIAAGVFPKPVKLGGGPTGKVGWPDHLIKKYDAKLAERETVISNGRAA